MTTTTQQIEDQREEAFERALEGYEHSMSQGAAPWPSKWDHQQTDQNTRVDWDLELPGLARGGRKARVRPSATSRRLDAGLEATRQRWERTEQQQEEDRRRGLDEGIARHEFQLLPGLGIAALGALCAACDEMMEHPLHQTEQVRYVWTDSLDISGATDEQDEIDRQQLDWKRQSHYGSQEATDENSYARVMLTMERWKDPKKRSFDRRLFWSGVNVDRQRKDREVEHDYQLYLPARVAENPLKIVEPVKSALELDFTGAIVRSATIRIDNWNGPMDSDPSEYSYRECEWSKLEEHVEVTDWQPDPAAAFQARLEACFPMLRRTEA